MKKIKVIRAFYIDGKVLNPGEVHEVSTVMADSAISINKAVAYTEEVPAEVPPTVEPLAVEEPKKDSTKRRKRTK